MRAAHFCEVLALLLSSRVPGVLACETAAGVYGSPVRDRLRARLADDPDAPLADALAEAGWLPPGVDAILRAGEISGTLIDALDKAARFVRACAEAEAWR